MQLLGSSKKVIDNKNGEIVLRLEIVEVVLVHCNLVKNNYQQASKGLFTFVPNKQFGQLIIITPSLTPHYHFHPLHRHLDISWVITAESSPLHIASSRT